MRVLLLFEGMIHLGLAAANRCVAYGQCVQHGGAEAEIWMPFGFKARSIVPSQSKSTIDGVPYEYVCFIPYHPKENWPFPVSVFIFLFVKYLGYTKLLLKLLFQRSYYDVVFIYDFGIFYSMLIRLFSYGKPLVYELCEIPYFDEESPSKRATKRNKREKFNYAWAQGVIPISNSLDRYVKTSKFGKTLRTQIIPILHRSNEAKIEFQNKAESNYIIHTGSLTQQKDGILTIIEALGEYNQVHSNNTLSLYCTGDLNSSPIREEIAAMLFEKNLSEYIHFTGYLDIDSLNNLLKGARFSILYKVENEQNLYCFPTKLASYMNYGLPTIVTKVGPMSDYIESETNGFVVPENDLPSLVSAMERLTKDSELLEKIRKHSIDTCREHFSIEANSVALVSFFEDVKNKA